MDFEVAPGDARRIEHRPCEDHQATLVDYGFKHPREAPFMPGCVAVYTVIHDAGVGHSTLSFGLTDHALARAHREEADRQIVERLLGEPDAPVAPSDMDL